MTSILVIDTKWDVAAVSINSSMREVVIMPKKKTNGTKQSEIPKKIDNEAEPKMKPVAIKWHELEQYVGQPIWDTREKKWRVLDWYRRTGNTYSITFSDIADWCSFLDRELYLEEVEENAK